MTYLKGSANGARIGGTTLGVPAGVFLLTTMDWTASLSWIGLLFLALFGFASIRPWALGIWTGEGAVEVRSWFRTYRLRAGDVEAVELVAYSGLVGFAVGWVPFIGRIRMLEVKLARRRLPLSLPSTVARQSRALELARAVRRALGLAHA